MRLGRVAMSRRVPLRAAALAGLLSVLTFAGTAAASGTFVQPVHVLAAFHGPTTGQGAYFGWAVSGLDDINGDGVTDLIVGEVNGGANGDGVPDFISGAPNVGSAVGHAYVYSGATGKVLARLHGHLPGDQFGAAVSGAGDLNRDGHGDLLVGAPGNGNPGTAPGRVYVISGRTFHVMRVLSAGHLGDSFGAGTAGTGDLNGDGVPDMVIGANRAGPNRGGAAYVYSGKTGARLFRIPGERGSVEFGRFFVAGVGDTNGDGVPDIYVGDYASNNRGAAGGFAAVYSGVDGTRLHAWRGAAGDGLGPGRGAGDGNGDGN